MIFILAIILLIVGFFAYRKVRPPAPVNELPVDTPATPMDPVSLFHGFGILHWFAIVHLITGLTIYSFGQQVATGKAPDSESYNRMSTETPLTGTTSASTGATTTAVATATAAEGGAPPPPLPPPPPPPPAAEATESSRLKTTPSSSM
ncbi:unnamed protein product [Angiostrongylus costaricensis]|uniref:Cytochrome b/b6 domain-containing protein n=1 Tax=Angiostrongylus costaricensis TaxID=334426 RepID=A0A0R3PBG9_ANGCS|nr:unnamed protein product [Angiostrongylus costaricensis]